MATMASGSGDTRQSPVTTAKVSPGQEDRGTPKVYWSESKQAFIGKYKHRGGWRNKALPVDITDEAIALRWFSAWLDDFLKGNPDGKPRLRQTVRSLLPQWVKWKKELPGVEPYDVDRAESTIRRYVLPHALADVDLETELKIGHAVDWVEHVQRSGRAPFTVRNIVQCVRTFISDCRGKGWIDLRENPFNDGFVKAKTKGAERVAGNETIIHLTKEQARKLVECESPGIPDVRKATNVLAVCTGMRANELQGLCWGDLHLKDKHPYVDVQRQLKVPGAVGKAAFKPPKKKSYRQVPLHPLAVSAVSWWAKRWVRWVGREPTPLDPVFPSPEGAFVPHAGAKLFRQDLVEAGVPATFEGHNQTFHALRRTFLTMLTDAGVQDSRVAALAGHGAKTVTAKHYVAKHMDEFYPAVLKLPLPKRVEWATK